MRIRSFFDYNFVLKWKITKKALLLENIKTRLLTLQDMEGSERKHQTKAVVNIFKVQMCHVSVRRSGKVWGQSSIFNGVYSTVPSVPSYLR